jgi:hypothetical protein
MKSTRWSFVLLLLPLLCPACPNGNSNPDSGLDLPAKQDGKAMTPSPICDAYLACLAAAEPQTFPAVLQTYQADGPCWKSQTAADGCTRACKQALETLSAKYPGVPACQPRPDAGAGGPGGRAQAPAVGRTTVALHPEDRPARARGAENRLPVLLGLLQATSVRQPGAVC